MPAGVFIPAGEYCDMTNADKNILKKAIKLYTFNTKCIQNENSYFIHKV